MFKKRLMLVVVFAFLLMLSASAVVLADNKPVTVYLAGDSTVMSYPPERAPQMGWGQIIGEYFSQAVTIENNAKGGRSSKSFINEGRLKAILDKIQPGDYLLIQFGHNDEKSVKDDPERKIYTEPHAEYKQYLKQYIAGAREHQAIPVLVTPVERRRFGSDGKINSTHTEWTLAMKEVAAEENVPLIDLEGASKRAFEELGPEGTTPIFLDTDNTHFKEAGARLVAKLVIEEMKKLDIDLKNYIVNADK